MDWKPTYYRFYDESFLVTEVRRSSDVTGIKDKRLRAIKN